MINELHLAINQIFSVEVNGKKLRKRKGESMEHYLMKCLILKYLDKDKAREIFTRYENLSKRLNQFIKSINNKISNSI